MAGWNHANDLVVGSGGQVYVRDSASTNAPTDATTAPHTSFIGMGYLDEDGVTVSVAPNIQEFNVWQSRQPARREALAQEITVSGNFAEWSEHTVPVVYGKGVDDAVSGAAGSFAFPAEGDALAEHSVLVDITDGTDDHRFYFERANQTEASETQFNRSNLAVLPFGLKVLAPASGGSPGSYFTDSTGFATTS